MGAVVITSKDRDVKIPDRTVAQVHVTKDYIEWTFSTEAQAQIAAERFIEAGFTYVYRPYSPEVASSNEVEVMKDTLIYLMRDLQISM